jgi:ribosomal protein L11 methylase PrmA
MTGKMKPERDPGSFRDPSGWVVHAGERVYRVATREALEHVALVHSSGLYAELTEREWLLPALAADDPPLAPPEGGAVLEHPRVPFISYPYEWPFALLKRAALLHLDVHLAALDCGVTLSDASAYNIQFLGSRPVFIDILSFRKYDDGDFWLGQRQFSEQFLNPLLLQSLCGVPFHAWYRGSLEGIQSLELVALLKWWQKLSWRLLLEVTLPARFQRRAMAQNVPTRGQAPRKLPLFAFRHMLLRMRRLIARLQPHPTTSVWEDYTSGDSYSGDEQSGKLAFVSQFVATARPTTVFDLGCNTGLYAEAALAVGAKRVIGFDADHAALDHAVQRADAKKLELLPLVIDAANPSPDQGWTQRERKGLGSRGPADALLALAIEHHLAIGRNIPLPDLIDWMVKLAPVGVIEFVPKEDPKVQALLRWRTDVFASYSPDVFERALGERARIAQAQRISQSGRTLYLYDRS